MKMPGHRRTPWSTRSVPTRTALRAIKDLVNSCGRFFQPQSEPCGQQAWATGSSMIATRLTRGNTKLGTGHYTLFTHSRPLFYPEHCPQALFTAGLRDRKSTRLNSSHVAISYAVFCLKKKM